MSNFDSQFPPGSPVAAASNWLNLILRDGDLAAAWPLTDPDLRRIAVAAWFDANPGHVALQGQEKDELVDALSVNQPTHWLWPYFAETQLREFKTTRSNVDLDKWAWGNCPRPYALDYKIAAFF